MRAAKPLMVRETLYKVTLLGHADWRRGLLRALAVVLGLKLLALAALKLAFFSGAEQPSVSAPLVERHLELDPTSSPSASGEAP